MKKMYQKLIKYMKKNLKKKEKICFFQDLKLVKK